MLPVKVSILSFCFAIVFGVVAPSISNANNHWQLRGSAVTKSFFEGEDLANRYRIQRTLKMYGFFGQPMYQGAIDGKFGPNTDRALNNLAGLYFAVDARKGEQFFPDQYQILGHPQTDGIFFEALLTGRVQRVLGQPTLCWYECE